jgi:hypothetical protein
MPFGVLCCQGLKKTYRISCTAESEVQTLALDRSRFPSRLAIRPRDLTRLLSNFQSSLQELTIIATEPAAGLPCVDDDIGGKAVELLSYIDPTKGAILFYVAGVVVKFSLNSAGDWVVNCDVVFGLQMTMTVGCTRNCGSTQQRSSWSMCMLVIR